jgi:hypothetical protein
VAAAMSPGWMGRTLAAVSSITSRLEHSNDTNTGQISSNNCFSNNAPEPAMTVTSRNLQLITGRAAREGARERVCFAQKPIRRDESGHVNNHRAAALHLVPRGRPQASNRAECLIISLKATGEQNHSLTVHSSVPPRWYQATLSPADPEGEWHMDLGPGPGAPRRPLGERAMTAAERQRLCRKEPW